MAALEIAATGALGNALGAALGTTAATSGAKSKTDKKGVVGEEKLKAPEKDIGIKELNDLLELAKYPPVVNMLKKVLPDIVKQANELKASKGGEDSIDISSLSKSEKDELMISLAEEGFSTSEINRMLKDGRIMKSAWGKLSPALQRKLDRLTPEEWKSVEAQAQKRATSGGNGNNDDNDDDDEKKKEKVKKGLDKLKKEADGEKKFKEEDPKSQRIKQAKEGQKRTGKNVDHSPDELKELTGAEKAEKLGEQIRTAEKNGAMKYWEAAHVTPQHRLPY